MDGNGMKQTELSAPAPDRSEPVIQNFNSLLKN